MNKDVIYIDVDDDVTAIIGKIKKAKEKIVALVPPKSSGALQSAVNLRLLARMAKSEKKSLVLVTNNQALVGLAANAKIPVAKNLQSRPELVEIPALIVDDEDDIIDGSQIPVGEHAQTVKNQDSLKIADSSRNDAIEATDLNIDGEDVTVDALSDSKGTKIATKKNKNRPKIPNFDSFRKKMLLFIIGGAALIALLVWMFVFAPSATIIITASTKPVPVSSTLQLGGTASTDFEKGIVTSITQQEQVDEVVSFQATGEKDVGEPATGVLEVSRLVQEDYTLPSGSNFTTSSGLTFVTQEDVVIPASIPCFPTYCAQSASVDVAASQSGTAYNGVTGSAAGPSGATGVFEAATSGGTSVIVKMVTAEDVDRANGELIGRSTKDQESSLADKFANGEVVVTGSFTVSRGAAVSSPAVGEATQDGKASLTIPTTYSVQAVQKADLESYLNNYLKSKLDDSNNQKVYSTGIEEATLSGYKQQGELSYATVNANGSVGPRIDESRVKDQVAGKRYGDVQQSLELIDGIKEVDVQFSYFWVRTVPNNPDKISIEFKIDEQ